MEAKDILGVIKGPIEKVFSFLGAEMQQTFNNRLLEYQIEEYKRNYYSKTLLHRSDKALKEFYQPLFIQESSEPLNNKILYTQNPPIPTDSIIDLFHRHKYITIIGSAGSGKSTLVKYLFVNCFEENYKIPIKIELRYLSGYKGNINDYVFNEIFKFQKLGFTDSIIDRLLTSGSFIFFLDGYDEINLDQKAKVINDINNFVKKYFQNYYLITSRPYTSVDQLPLFKNYYVCDLRSFEIASFVRKQMPISEREIANKIIRAINAKENSSYISFLSNPLLLSMFILTFQTYSNIPQKKSEFYHQVFDTLFSIHDSLSKLAFNREKVCGLSKDQFEEALRLFSFISFFEEKLLFPLHYLEDKLTYIKSTKKELKFDNSKFIEDLQVAIGILHKDGLEYTFPHRSLQEYFAASYIEKLEFENKKIFYQKLKDVINKNFRKLLDQNNFYTLLSEMDYYYINKFTAIPLITEIYEALLKTKRLTVNKAYDYYTNILLVSFILLQVEQKHKEISEELKINDAYIYELTRGMFGASSPMRKYNTKYLGVTTIAGLAEIELFDRVKYFKNNGKEIIEQFNSYIENLNKSDKDIINFIV